MIPATFVVLDKLPVTASGKLDRRALPALAHANPLVNGAYVAPRNETERALANIWSDLLGVKRVGIHDNFFELGGDSILSIQIVARANQAGLRLRTAHLFEHQTIAGIAALAGSQVTIQAEQGVPRGAAPLTPVQHWFMEQHFADPHHYNQSVLIELPPAVDPATVSAALDRLVTHHDALRLRFSQGEAGWQQTVAPLNERVALTQVDISSVATAERETAFQAAAAQLQASLDLAHGPLVGASLVDVGDPMASYLLLVIHHLAVDGVSWGIVLEDFRMAYEELAAGEDVHLPDKTTSFLAWAHHLMHAARSAEAEAEAPYW